MGPAHRRVFFCCVLVALAAAARPSPAQQAAGENVRWVTSVNTALAEALRSRRLVLVYFRGASVGECAQMERGTFAHPAVARQSRQLVMLWQDVEQSDEARQYAASLQVDVLRLPGVLVLKPDGTELHRFVGQIASANQMYGLMRHVIAFWDALGRAEADPTDAAAFKDAARWQVNLTSSVNAQPLLEKVLKLDPEGKQVYLDQVYLWLARIHGARAGAEEGAKAVEYCNRCIETNLENLNGAAGAARELLGSIAINSEKFDEAREHFQAMLDGDPFDRYDQASIALYRMALLAAQQEKTDEAMALCQRIIQEYPFGRFSYTAVTFRARLYQDADDSEAAIREYERAIAWWPGTEAARHAGQQVEQLRQQAATRAADGDAAP